MLAPSTRLASYERSLDSFLDSTVHLDVVRAEIQKDLDYLPHMMTQLKRRMNIRVPLLCLPIEVIMEIMLRVADIWPAAGGHDVYRDKIDLGWIHLGHVCHTLRKMLLAHHILWAENICAIPNAQDEFFQRSGDCPLNLHLSETSKYDDDIVQFIADHICRARAVSLSIHPSGQYLSEWLPFPDALSGQDLQHLEHLTVDFDEGPDERCTFISAEDILKPLPAVHTPRLRTICLRNFYIPFYPGTLTSLELGSFQGVFAPLPSASQFLDMLGSCRSLKYLGLKWWIPPVLAPSPHPTVFLPSLIEFVIEDDVDPFIALRSHLQFPHTVISDIAIALAYNDQSDLSSLDERLEKLQEPLRNDAHDGIDGIRFCTNDLDHLDIHLFVSTPVAYVPTQLRYSPRCSESNSVLILRQLNGPLPFMHAVPFGVRIAGCERLRYLGLEFDLDPKTADYGTSTWGNMLGELTGVHTLRVDDMEPLIAALTPSAEAESRLLLPSLRHLWIENFDHVVGPSTKQDRFLEFLLARKRAGAGLERIRAGRARRRSEDSDVMQVLQRVRAIVPKVECELDGTLVKKGWATGLSR